MIWRRSAFDFTLSMLDALQLAVSLMQTSDLNEAVRHCETAMFEPAE